MEKKFWKQISFWIWVVIAVGIVVITPLLSSCLIPRLEVGISSKFLQFLTITFIFIGLGILFKVKPLWLWIGSVVLMAVPWWGTVLLTQVLVFKGLGIWAKKCFKQIGPIEAPSQAVFVRFGKPVDVVGPGFYFCFYPFENFKEIPTGQYQFCFEASRGLCSKEEKKLKSQPLQVKVVVYFHFPKRDGVYPFPETDLEGRITRKTDGSVNWVKKEGKELLINRLYYCLPIQDLTIEGTPEQIGKLFEGVVMAAIRHVIAGRTSLQCKENIPEITVGIKDFLFREEGNPMFECGIPKECLDVELVVIKLPDEIEKAYLKPEIAIKDAEAAKYERIAIQRRLAPFRDEEGRLDSKAVTTLAPLIFKRITGEEIGAKREIPEKKKPTKGSASSNERS